jgi:1,4-alpha-glucan branching enzyme
MTSHPSREAASGSAPLSTSEPILVKARWDAVLEGSARTALERVLPAYCAARRWYRTKTRRVQSARITAAFPLPFGGELARVVLVELLLEDDVRDTYVLPLTFVHGAEAKRLRTRRAHSIVLPLRVEEASGAGERLDGFVIDALALEGFSSELLVALARGRTLSDAGSVLQFHPLASVDAGVGPARLVDGEQTNTSVLFDEHYVGKVVRKVEPGESAELELGRFLTAAGYTHTPALVGWVDVRKGEEAPSTIGLLHTFVANRGDAWEHATASLDAFLESSSRRDSGPPRLPPGDLVSRALHHAPAEIGRAIGSYGALAERLGHRVGEMHVALASRPDDDAFSPEPLDRASREAIALGARSDLLRLLDRLGTQGEQLTDATRTALAAVRQRIRALEGRLSGLTRLGDAGVRTRVHGDLHLGQVLFTGTDFVIIDFEGEPARTLEERKRKRSPLVDVASMLRSFHYASVSSLRARPEGERSALSGWAALWQRAASAMFLRGWLGAVDGSAVVPRSHLAMRALLDAFLLEKCIYEVGYEMNNRPDWVEIPLEGLREIAGADVTMTTIESPPSAGPEASAGFTPVPSTKPSPTHQVPLVSEGGDATFSSFAEGKATHAHHLLGAHPHRDGSTRFAVWAPGAAHVDVVGDFNEWKADVTPLVRASSGGVFTARVEGASPGHLYKYRITPAGGGEPFDKADPFAVRCEQPPGNASVIASLEYRWGDEAWMSERAQHAAGGRPMSVYEVHLGSWRRNMEEGNRFCGYREIASSLAAHAKSLGFTHVELMPLLEHPFYGSWGYGVTGFFAATSRYGSPTDLMYLVDTLHRAGLGVIFDWVPAHFARDPHGLATFDGTPLFEPDDPARAVHPAWGTGVFDFTKPEVRSFLLSSATFWIETFHADGLRIDGVESILHEDHHGGRENDAGVSFLRELTSTLAEVAPAVVLSAEDSSAWQGVTRPVSEGGLGFDLKWDMGFAHDVRRYLAIDPLHRSENQGLLTFRSVYAATERFVLPLSHDDVIGERGGSLLEQMNGDRWQKLANLRLLYALAWAQPGKKLLFMGDEFAQPSAWHHDKSLDWHVAKEPGHDGIQRMVRDLNRLYREVSALHQGDATPNGFEWIDGSNAAMSIIVFARRGRVADDVVIAAFNFTPLPRHPYRIGVPAGGHWREIFNSDSVTYGGSGHGNLGGAFAVPYPWHGRPSSVVVTLPPLGAIFLARGG